MSVVVPCYNFESFIRDSIDSILVQEYDNLEIIVCDDASTDHSQEILKEYDRQYPGTFKLILSSVNHGLTRNINQALALVSGKYTAFLSGDDVWMPGKLKSQIEHMERNPKCHICYTDTVIFDSENPDVFVTNSVKEKQRSGNQGTVIMHGTFCGASSVVVRTSEAPKAFSTLVNYTAEWMYWVDCLRNGGEIHFIDAPLTKYRRHVGNVTTTKTMKINFETLVQAVALMFKYPLKAHYALYRIGYGFISILKRTIRGKKFYDMSSTS